MLNKNNVVFNIPKKRILASLVLGENSSVRAYSGCCMHPIVARMRLLFFQKYLQILYIFAQIFKYFALFCPFFDLFIQIAPMPLLSRICPQCIIFLALNVRLFSQYFYSYPLCFQKTLFHMKILPNSSINMEVRIQCSILMGKKLGI